MLLSEGKEVPLNISLHFTYGSVLSFLTGQNNMRVVSVPSVQFKIRLEGRQPVMHYTNFTKAFFT